MTADILAGIDVGGSKIAVVLATTDLAPIGRHVIPTGAGDAGYAVDRIAHALESTLQEAGRATEDLCAIGVGVPGRVEPADGTVTLAVNLGWHDLPLGPRLAARFGVPVGIENDVRAAAAGLHARHVTGDGADLAYLGIGTGISAGVVMDGVLHRGPRGLAGEIGHVVLEPGGPRCACGLRGCFEAVASGRGIGELAQAAVDAGEETTLPKGKPCTAVDVYREAKAGDQVCRRIVERAGRYVARAVHELVMTYDVRRVVLGGGVTHAGVPFLDPVTRALDELRAASELAREALPADVVHLLPPDADAGGWGGVILARSAARRTASADAGQAASVGPEAREVTAT
jgi:glucokinase-like ROK family protein